MWGPALEHTLMLIELQSQYAKWPVGKECGGFEAGCAKVGRAQALTELPSTFADIRRQLSLAPATVRECVVLACAALKEKERFGFHQRSSGHKESHGRWRSPTIAVGRAARAVRTGPTRDQQKILIEALAWISVWVCGGPACLLEAGWGSFLTSKGWQWEALI